MQEVERKYEGTGDHTVVLDFSGVASPGEPATFRLRATHLDTPDHRLTEAGWVLRRRQGGHDAGWHLKCPAGTDIRTEQQLPDAPRLPAGFRALVTAAFGHVPLVPVAYLTTDRTERPLRRDHRVLARLAVDRVVATASGGESRWGELEVELEPGVDVAVLDELEPPLRAAGYARAGQESKISRALAGVPRLHPPADPDGPARDVLLAYLGRQVGMIQSLEAPVLADAVDAVHKSRVATRRLRSLLRTFEPLLDDAWAEDLRDELRWLAEALGAPRDAEVLRDEFGDLLAELGPESAEGPVAHRLLGHLAERHDRAHAALRDVMATRRYAELHDRLAGLLLEAPWRSDAAAPACDALPPLVAVARGRVERLVARAERRPEELERWHDVRKAAKAVRYCTEALVGAFGPDMRAVADRWTEVTEAFGTLQDAVVARELLAEVGALADAAGEPTRTYRVLADVQDDRADAALAEGREAVAVALQA